VPNNLQGVAAFWRRDGGRDGALCKKKRG